MRIKKSAVFCGIVILFNLCVLPLQAQWSQNSGVGPYSYTDPNNWVGGIINNVFTNPPISGLTVTFTNNYTLTNGVLLNFPGSSNVIFQSANANAYTLQLYQGNFLRTNCNGGVISLGVTNSTNPLIVDLNGASRTFGGGTALSTSSSLITTMNVYAQIEDSSGFTNGITCSGGNTYTYLLNTNNTFLGPVSFSSVRGGGFASIKPIGGGPSALGAPKDPTNGLITIADGSSFGSLKYLGSGDTSDRSFMWNITFSNTLNAAYEFVNAGSGLLDLAGQWTFPTNITKNTQFDIIAYSAPLEFDGYIDGHGNVNGTSTYLLFYGGPLSIATNRITLTGSMNDFQQFAISNVVVAYNNTAPPGTPSALGSGTNIVLGGGNNSSAVWAGDTGQGSTLQYFGPSNTTFSQNIQISGGVSSCYWGLDNAGTNTTLTLSNNISWNLPGAEIDFFPRTLFINPNSSATNVVLSYIPDANVTVSGSPYGTIVAAANPVGYTVNNGGVLELLNPTNTFAGGVVAAYARTIEAMTLTNIGLPSSIGTGLYPYLDAVPSSASTGIALGSTDSQRGGTLSYIGTNSTTSNQKITILGDNGTQCSGTLRNDSPNNSSLHMTDTSAWTFFSVGSVMPSCLVILKGSAQTANTVDSYIPDVNGAGTGSLLVNGSDWRLTANQTYSGTTMVATATLILDGSIASGLGTTVSAGGILTGTGTNNETINVVAGGEIGAGDGGIGTLTINGNLTNAGTIYMKISKLAGTNDQLVLGANTLNYGGNLTVTNLAGTLALNDSFVLFPAGAYTGSITSSNLPPLNAGLAWNLSNLSVNGSVNVVSGGAVPQPDITGIALNGTTLTMTATNGTASGTYYLLESTNVGLPLSQWTPLLTNMYDVNGNVNLSTNVLNRSIPRMFYILSNTNE